MTRLLTLYRENSRQTYLLVAGPALSLPNMLVIRTVLGTQKTLLYCALVVVMATLTGVIYGNFW